MNNINIFFNERIENHPNPITKMGDIALTPFRYLFEGTTIRITEDNEYLLTVHSVPSFHKQGGFKHSMTDLTLCSSSKNMIKTVIAIALLIPATILGALIKGISYAFADTRKSHAVLDHFKNRVVTLDTRADDVNWFAISNLLCDAAKGSYPPATLVIHGNNRKINRDFGILDLNPSKIILHGARIVHEPSNHSLYGLIDDNMADSGLYESSATRSTTVTNGRTTANTSTFTKIYQASSIKEALAMRAPKKPSSLSSYHMVIQVPK